MTGTSRPRRAELSEADIDTLIEASMRVMKEENLGVNALITLTPEAARTDLRCVAAARHAGTPLALDGMTVVVKDNIDIGGVLGTVGSPWFDHRIPARDAVVVERLRKNGAVITATTNLHELAFGGTSTNPHFGAVRNPWALDRIPGGSSGGSAVAVACDWVTGALGTDTGGSVRCPASMTGIAGLRPTFGTVTNEGVFPLARSFDTVGFMSRDVRDVEHLLTRGCDDPREYVEYDGQPLRVGLPNNPYFANVTAPISQAVGEVAKTLSDLGHQVTPVLVPDPELCDEVARSIVRREAFELHEQRLSEGRDRIGADVANRLQLGAEIDDGNLSKLLDQRRVLTEKFDNLLSQVDVLLLPTIPVSPATIGGGEMLSVTEMSLRFTYLWGVAGLPALSFPCGIDELALPVGAQLVGARLHDRVLCGLAAQYQGVTQWHQRRPARPFRSS